MVRGDDEAVGVIASAVSKAAGVEAAYDSLIADSFMNRVRDLLANQSTYPLFDEMLGDVVRSHVAEGLFEVRPAARRRGKQAGVASQFIESLPSLPAASIAEILDISEELRRPLTNFRAAVAEIERSIQSAAFDTDFPAEVEDLYIEKVAPALEEIEQLVRENSYLRQLMRATVGDAKSIMTAVLTIGVASLAGVPDLITAALAVPAAAAALRAAFARSGARDRRPASLFPLQDHDTPEPELERASIGVIRAQRKLATTNRHHERKRPSDVCRGTPLSNH